LCIIGGGLVAIAGAILVSAAATTNTSDLGSLAAAVLVFAVVLIIMGLARWA
jgi:hypothetical protein